jgi:hypothetical protein
MELETDRQISASGLQQPVCEPRAPHPPGSCTWPPPLVLRNGLARGRRLPEVLQAQQHGKHPFELAVEMHFVAAEPLQFVGVEGRSRSTPLPHVAVGIVQL